MAVGSVIVPLAVEPATREEFLAGGREIGARPRAWILGAPAFEEPCSKELGDLLELFLSGGWCNHREVTPEMPFRCRPTERRERLFGREVGDRDVTGHEYSSRR